MTPEDLLSIVAAILHAGRRIEAQLAGTDYPNSNDAVEWIDYKDTLARAKELLAQPDLKPKPAPPVVVDATARR